MYGSGVAKKRDRFLKKLQKLSDCSYGHHGSHQMINPLIFKFEYIVNYQRVFIISGGLLLFSDEVQAYARQAIPTLNQLTAWRNALNWRLGGEAITPTNALLLPQLNGVPPQATVICTIIKAIYNTYRNLLKTTNFRFQLSRTFYN